MSLLPSRSDAGEPALARAGAEGVAGADSMPRVALGERLQRINLIALGAAVAIVAVFVVISSLALSLMALVDVSRVQAKVLADNATAALAFEDARAAGELLQSLRNSPDVRGAVLYRGDGGVLAAFQRAGQAAPATLP
jgi:hypothetical protein